MIDQLTKTNNSNDLFGEQVNNIFSIESRSFVFLDSEKDPTGNNDVYE
jgi:hypothetical protein